MQTDTKALRQGVKALSYARSQVHMICGTIRNVVGEAEKSNNNAKFKNCARKIAEIVVKMEATTKDMVEVGQKLEALACIVAKFENE